MNNKATADLLKLVAAHPNLPVKMLVNYEVCCGDDYPWWLGELKSCDMDWFIVIEMYGENRVFFDSDKDDLVSYYMEQIYDEYEENGKQIADEEAEEMAYERVLALPWKQAIVCYIDVES